MTTSVEPADTRMMGIVHSALRRDLLRAAGVDRRAASPGRTAQPLYGLGPLLVAAGIGVLATEASTQPARTAVTIAFLALATGALAWAWSVYQRATRIAEFAHSTLPAFLTFSDRPHAGTMRFPGVVTFL